jgi:hypothetical protein
MTVGPVAATAIGRCAMGFKADVRVYSSFEEENAAEHQRLREMTPEERLREFSVLQMRRWGETWGEQPIEKRVTWERVAW